MSTPHTTPTNDTLPSGIDWADGKKIGPIIHVGTETPKELITAFERGKLVNGVDDISIQELPESPTLERAEQATATHSFIMPYEKALDKLAIYGRGSLREDSAGNYYRTLSSTLTRLRGNMAQLNIVSESLSYDTPPDEFGVTPVELGLDILKHPRYYYAIMPTNLIPGFNGVADTDDQSIFKQQVLRGLQAYKENPVVPTDGILNTEGKFHEEIQVMLGKKLAYKKFLNPNFNKDLEATTPLKPGESFPATATAKGKPNPAYRLEAMDFSAIDPENKVAMACAAALEVMQKIWRMEDTPYTVGWQITWSSYYFSVPFLNPGGYIEDPNDPADEDEKLPDYFSKVETEKGSRSIFTYLASWNPQCYSSDGTDEGYTRISWLRKADEIEYQRTWFRKTRTWIGAPIGAWDGDLYSSGSAPKKPEDFKQVKFGEAP